MLQFLIPKFFSKHKLNYSGQDLRGKFFAWRNLTGANFNGADIRGVTFKGANLENADFRGAVFGSHGNTLSISYFFNRTFLLIGIFIFSMVLLKILANYYSIPYFYLHITIIFILIVLLSIFVSFVINFQNRYVHFNNDIHDYPRTLFPLNKTILWKAHLKGANFSGTTLNDTFFTEADIENTNFKDAKKLGVSDEYPENSTIKLTLLRGTILDEEKVRQLLCTGNGKDQDFSNLKLKGAYLVETDLSNANFLDANLTKANLKSANLEDANLTRCNVLDTNFEGATLTGISVKDWHTSNNTIFDDVSCEYIYLEKNERYPNSPNNFQKSEFSKFIREKQNIIIIKSKDEHWFKALISKIVIGIIAGIIVGIIVYIWKWIFG